MDNMIISIDFCGPQRVVTKTNSIDMPIDEHTRVTDALEYVNARYPELHLESDMILITVNRQAAPLDRVLKPNDAVSFVPPLAGG